MHQLLLPILTSIAALILLIMSAVFIRQWVKSSREVLFYWGMGLGIWGAALIVNMLSGFFPQITLLTFVELHLLGLAFVFFLLYGTLNLVLKKQHANSITIMYYLLFFVTTIILGGALENQKTLIIWHNILFITPPALVMGVYFYSYYRSLRKNSIWWLYNAWIFFAILAYGKTWFLSTGLQDTLWFTVWQVLMTGTIILLAFCFLKLMTTETTSWNLMTRPRQVIINENMKEFFSTYFYDRAEEIIRQEMEKFDIKEFIIASDAQKIDFIEDTIKFHFSRVASLQKQDIIRTHLMAMLDLSIDMNSWNGYSNTRF